MWERSISLFQPPFSSLGAKIKPCGWALGNGYLNGERGTTVTGQSPKEANTYEVCLLWLSVDGPPNDHLLALPFSLQPPPVHPYTLVHCIACPPSTLSAAQTLGALLGQGAPSRPGNCMLQVRFPVHDTRLGCSLFPTTLETIRSQCHQYSLVNEALDPSLVW